MNNLNEYLIDTNYNDSYLYTTHPTEQIKKGNGFSLSLGYLPSKFIDFGFYGSFQTAKITRTPRLLYTDPVNSEESYYYGNYSLKTSSFGVGITTSLYLNKLLNFENKGSQFLQKLLLAFETQGGIGYSHLFYIYSFSDFPDGSFEFNSGKYKSTDFQAQVNLKIGYNYLDKSVKSSIGFKLGYQFYKTSTVRNSIDKGLKSDNSINLDFSGIFFGVFVKLGK